MDRAYQQHAWAMQPQMHPQDRIPVATAYTVIQSAQARYESARSFDVDDDLEFNPCLSPEEYSACFAESSLSTRSNRSESNSPPQQQSLPHSVIGMNPYAQQAQVVHQQHQGFANQAAASGRHRKRNPIQIVDPRNYAGQQQQQQASQQQGHANQWR
ncbi:hypothetical protein BCR37DRAFT_377403 [Protomyces lactucae-debilis]|uniref:Uncharacterized protein n=1 Tax=Protomyces lactucae-debilis TaxID=2754530 RepID=A0A1Y2FSK2_PROLT|nr:uncharacterized protein BCR37DRAFT_377403 [Protomyces lactucae-debilis]ORY85695.1 hypothetical protein BCR37DRAFT_377403 [Protomyces lactucae-debilis]